MTATPTPTTQDAGLTRPPRAGLRPRGHPGWVVAGSLAAGLTSAVLLAGAPFVPATEDGVTGAILCGFALGWTMLAVLSAVFTDQPQPWALVPALFMGLGGLLLMMVGTPVRDVLNWMWPPALLVLAIWMIVRTRRGLRSRSRWFLYPVIAVLVLAALGGGYETVGEAVDAKAYPMPGQLIDVGGHSLHLSCTGSGSPTVVLEPGLGEMSSNMGWIAPVVASDTRVCVYDRAGRGWSQPADTAQDGTQIATELHTLLQRGHVPGPYVLAGHSFGGLYVLAFAARYPDDVAGMVLVDSTAPKPAAEPGAAAPDGNATGLIARVTAGLSISARLGLGRLYALVAFDSLPPQSRDEVRASLATPSNLRSAVDEFVQANTAMRQAGTLTDFADKPLVVLTAGVGSDAAHSASQNHLATLSTNSVHHVVDGADHEALVADQEHAAATTQAIVDVVASVRNTRPLIR
ncbi:MAG: alpha/beta hydrolase [Propionicimonas sp.]